MYTIYTKPNCPYCVNAKKLLTSKNLEYQEVHVYDGYSPKDPNKSYINVDELKKLIPGIRTVPQIFADGIHIGGFNELEKSFL